MTEDAPANAGENPAMQDNAFQSDAASALVPSPSTDTNNPSAAAMTATRRRFYPEMGSLDDDADLGGDSTAEIAANSPRYRRKSSIRKDGVHDLAAEKLDGMAPAQLYSTMSGRLFHSGRICIVLVGPPARGKTHIAVSVARYLQWLGVKTRIFHLGDYRRATMGSDTEIPHDYFFTSASAKSVKLRQTIIKKCRDDIFHWLNHENGQVAIYDAVNPLAVGRRSLAQEFQNHDVQTLFLESFVTDKQILSENARNVKISSPDFAGMDPDEAARLYLDRIHARIPDFETMDENDLNYIKLINAGQKQIVNNVSFGYISGRIVFYLTNLHIKFRRIFFARAGTSCQEDSYKADANLSPAGKEYAEKMTEALISHRETELSKAIENGLDVDMKPLTVWTSTRRRTIETAEPLKQRRFTVQQRSLMSALNPGVCEKLSEQEIKLEYPEEVEKHEVDPYHHRYPRAESYHDLAVRLEPIILELEREKNDVLIIAHESVLRVLYGYLLACDAMSIPKLKFPRNYIFEIVPASYQNHARQILIDGIDSSSLTAPNSPDDKRRQAGGASGVVSPMVQLDPSMGALGIGGSSTPLATAGANSPLPGTPFLAAGQSMLSPSGASTLLPPAAQNALSFAAGSSTPQSSVDSSTPLPSSGTHTPIVLDEPAEIDESNVVGKESDF